ncbi:MAG TPA: Hrp-dependent type III effector protein, partial [Cyanobacteria bacterium UBA11166]|nr:Hrp-dependent type III effector protein [Cyanobacteria bacterium UBA11166]
MSAKPKIIVLDDDPTGSQTVHSCLLLTRWDLDTLQLGLRDDSPIFFILTNTRALTPEQATSVTREVCHNLKIALDAERITDFLVVSRSDSTLRGHYPVETDVIAEEVGPFDAHFLVPAFFEGGRITKESIHYLMIDGIPTPVHETEFARDSVFSYHYSYLPDYVEEKTKSRIKSNDVERFLLGDIRQGSLPRLQQLTNNQCCVVDGENQADLDNFATDILTAAAQGKHFLFRSAASILTSLANLGPQPVAAEDMAQYVREGKPGAVIVGSHVKKTTQQLENLLKVPGIVGVEVDVAHLLDESGIPRAELLENTLKLVREIHENGNTPVVYTSRQELVFPDVETRLNFGLAVSALLMDIVRGLPDDIGFLISKGGITSNDVLSTGLSLRAARLLGQIIPGCSVVRTPEDHPLFPNLPVVLFPGNVGDTDALATTYQRFLANYS